MGNKKRLTFIWIFVVIFLLSPYPEALSAKKKITLKTIKKWERKNDSEKILNALKEMGNYIPIGEREIKVAAIRALGRLENEEAIPIILNIVHKDRYKKSFYYKSELPYEAAFSVLLEYKDPDPLISAMEFPEVLDIELLSKGFDRLSREKLPASQWKSVLKIFREKKESPLSIDFRRSLKYLERADIYLEFLLKKAGSPVIEPLLMILNSPDSKYDWESIRVSREKIKEFRDKVSQGISSILNKSKENMKDLAKIILHHKDKEIQSQGLRVLVKTIKESDLKGNTYFKELLTKSKGEQGLHVKYNYKPGVLTFHKNKKISDQLAKLKPFSIELEKTLKNKGYRIVSENIAGIVFIFTTMERSEESVYRRRLSRPGAPYPAGFVFYFRLSFQLKNSSIVEGSWEGPMRMMNLSKLKDLITGNIDAFYIANAVMR